MSGPVARLTTALADRYRVERELGQGGMAMVYLAHDVRHDRPVALKVLRPELAAILGADRFLAEIKTTANLQHPHILSLFDSGEAEGLVFYVMPYVEGESLRDRLKREHQLPVDEAIRITREVADALDYAHRHKVIHRDIKPENILLHDGRALVADFGIALAVSRSDGGTRMTETGMSLGTPHYMAPEQAMGEKEITPKADIYALACVLYEMLMGEPPFTGPTAQAIIAKVMTDHPAGMTVHRKSIPPFIEEAVLTGLEKLAADRFATAAEFAAALGGAVSTRTATRRAVAAPGDGRWRRIAIAASLVAVAAVAFGAWAWGRRSPAPTARLAVAFPVGQQIRAVTTHRFALSPDGSRLVFIGPDSAGGTQLWVRELNALTGRPLPGTGGAMAPFFSHDGQSVAFFTGTPGDLKVIGVGGGLSRTVVRDSASPWGGDWDDRDRIYFTHARSAVARVPAAGGPIEVVSRLDSTRGETEHDWAQHLPGGKALLVQMWHSSINNAEIGVLDLATGVATPIIDGLWARYIPTGHIVYVAVNGMLYSVPFDPGSRRVTGPPITVAEQVQIDVVSGSGEFSISNTGTLAYLSGGGAGSSRVVWVDRSGKQTPIDTSWRGQFGAVALSPDESRLAISIYGDAGQQVWIKRLPGGPLSRMTFGSTDADRPQWTADGRRLGFVATRGPGGVRTAMVQRADGSAPAEPLFDTTRAVEQVEWAPDGRHYLARVGGNSGTRDIVLRALGDSSQRTLVGGPSDEFAPAVSPDGRWFAYVSNESGRSEVFVRSLADPGEGRTQVSANGGEEPRWSRAGREIFYRTRGGEMMSVDVTLTPTFGARPPRRLFTAPSMATDPYHHAYTVARDGRFLMVNHTPLSGDLVMVLNWFDELRGRQ